MKSLAEAVALTLRSLLGDPCPVLPPSEEPSDRLEYYIKYIIILFIHSHMISPMDVLPPSEKPSDRLVYQIYLPFVLT